MIWIGPNMVYRYKIIFMVSCFVAFGCQSNACATEAESDVPYSDISYKEQFAIRFLKKAILSWPSSEAFTDGTQTEIKTTDRDKFVQFIIDSIIQYNKHEQIAEILKALYSNPNLIPQTDGHAKLVKFCKKSIKKGKEQEKLDRLIIVIEKNKEKLLAAQRHALDRHQQFFALMSNLPQPKSDASPEEIDSLGDQALQTADDLLQHNVPINWLQSCAISGPTDTESKSLLSHVCSQQQCDENMQVRIAKLLMDAGANVNLKEQPSQNTALHFAVFNNRHALIKLLLANTAHELPNAAGTLPINYAEHYFVTAKSVAPLIDALSPRSSTTILPRVLPRIANFYDKLEKALARMGGRQLSSDLLDVEDPATHDTALMAAAQAGNEASVDIILKNAATTPPSLERALQQAQAKKRTIPHRRQRSFDGVIAQLETRKRGSSADSRRSAPSPLSQSFDSTQL